MAYPYLSDVFREAFGVNLPLPLPMFGLMVGVAFFTGQWLATREAKRIAPQQPEDIVTNACFIAFFTGLIGARIFHVLEYPREFLEDPAAMLFSRGGFTIFGGLIAGTISAAVFLRIKRVPLPPMLDVAGLGLMLAYAIGRIGCQIAGDGDWGIPADMAAKPDWLPTWFWAQTYENNIAGVTIPPPGVYPTPLYETLMSLVAFGILWGMRKHKHQAGWLFGLYMVLAGIERLLIENIRVNTTYEIAGMQITQAQIISVLCIVGGIAVLIWRWAPRPTPAT